MFDWIDRFLHNPTVLAFIGIAVALIAVMWVRNTVAARDNKQEPGRLLRLNNKPGLNALGWFAVVLLPIWLVLIVVDLYSIYLLVADYTAELTGSDLRWHALSFVALLTAFGGLVSAPLALIRTFTTERQTTTAEQAHVTDQINTAVQGLGAEKVVWHDDKQQTLPNLEVRIGAIYALERIAVHSHPDHIQIMEILCAYIRENAPASDARTPEQDGIAPLPEVAYSATDAARDAYVKQVSERADKLEEWAQTVPAPRSDIRVALAVIGRRDDARIALERDRKVPGSKTGHYVPDLRETNLQRADLRELNFSNALLAEAHLQGAFLWQAHLEGANLSGAHLEGAGLEKAHLERADLRQAHLVGANLGGAHLEGADLAAAHLERANLGGAHLERADLWGARLQEANLTEAHLQGANLGGAHLQEANLGGAHLQGANLGGAHLQEASLWEAHLQGASLWEAHLERASLARAELDEKTDLTGASLQFAWVQDVTWESARISQSQIDSMFGDGSVKLPPDLSRPAHWPGDDLEGAEFFKEWILWQSDPDSYTPP